MEFSPSLAGGSQCGEAVKWRMPRREARAGRRRKRKGGGQTALIGRGWYRSLN